jgi:hypothetical protein
MWRHNRSRTIPEHVPTNTPARTSSSQRVNSLLRPTGTRSRTAMTIVVTFVLGVIDAAFNRLLRVPQRSGEREVAINSFCKLVLGGAPQHPLDVNHDPLEQMVVLECCDC